MPTEEEKREIRERLDRLAAGEKVPPRQPTQEPGFMGGAPPKSYTKAPPPSRLPPARIVTELLEDGGLVITDIRIPFHRWVLILVNVFIAAVPATILMGLFWWFMAEALYVGWLRLYYRLFY